MVPHTVHLLTAVLGLETKDILPLNYILIFFYFLLEMGSPSGPSCLGLPSDWDYRPVAAGAVGLYILLTILSNTPCIRAFQSWSHISVIVMIEILQTVIN